MSTELARDEARNRIEQLYDRDDWCGVLEEHTRLGDDSRCVLWPKLDADDLSAVASFVRSRGGRTLVSVGCGSGLLEWLLHKATGLDVIGVEVNRHFWRRPGGRRTFLERVVFPEDEDFREVTESSENALGFCYFNDRPAFDAYVAKYTGDTLIVVGPGPEVISRHSDPRPTEELEGWTLAGWRSLGGGSTGDCAAFYIR